MVVSLLITDVELSIGVCIVVDRLAQSVDMKTNRKLGQLSLHTGLIGTADNCSVLGEPE